MNANSMIKSAETLMQPEVRAGIRANPRGYALANGIIEADSSVEINLVVSEAGKMFIPVFTADANHALSHDQLGKIAGGVQASTAGSIGSIGCALCICTCASSASTAGTAGSAIPEINQ